MLLLPLLLLLLSPSTALSRRQFDWNDCRLQACYVPDSCTDVTTTTLQQTTGSSTPSPPHALVLATRAKPLSNNRTACPFVIAIRPFSTTAWVVQLRLRQKQRLRERRIDIKRDSKLVYQCAGHDNGSITVTGGNADILVHPDSYRAHARMYCLFTVTSKSGNALDTSGFEVVYDGQSTALKLDSMDNIMDYVSCDGTKITMSTIKPPVSNSIVAPVDVTRPVVACPPGKNWQLWVENPVNGTLIATGSIVCSASVHSYYIDVGDRDGDLWEMTEFKAVCAASLACTTCEEPLFSPCPLCARVRYWPGESTHCSTLTYDNKTSSGPSRLAIDGRHYVGEPVCGAREDGGGVGWSIKDARNRTVEFGAAACVKEVRCHSASFLRLECAEPEQCEQPLTVEFEQHGLSGAPAHEVRFRATDADAWADAHELLCDADTGHWSAFHGNNDDKTVLAHNSTVECVAPLDPALFYGSIAVTVGILLFYATFLPHLLWTRKARAKITDAEFDKRQAELSKAFAKIKEYPRSPEKSDGERSRQSEMKEEKKVGKPIVDTRIYPDELTLKRKKKKKKEDKKEEKKADKDFLRPRELEDPMRIFCKSIKGGWEQWIAKTGGIVQEKKPREEVLRIRAERKAAREKRIEEEKQRRAEEERMPAKPAPSPSSPAPKQSAVKSTGGGGGLATDQYLYKMGVTPPPATTKEQPKEDDRFVTIGAAIPARPAPKKYKKHSTGAAPAKNEEIKFDPPTISRDTASVLHLEPATSRKEEFVTAEETDLNEETDAREKTPARTDDRAISASKMAPPAKASDLAPPRTDDRAISASKMGPAKPNSDVAPPRTDDRAISASKMGPAAHPSSPKDESGMGDDVAVEGTEDEKRKRKKRKTKKTSKSGGGEDLPKTVTAVDNEPTVDVDRNNSRKERSTPVMTSPSPLSPSNSTPTAETKRKRKKHREAVESKGIAKGLAAAIRRRDGRAHSCHGPHCVAKPTCEPGRLSCREARRIVADLSAKINLYFGQADQEAIATLYSDDCVIIDKQTGSAAYGHAGVIATNSALAQGQPMIWTTSNKTIDLASSHFVLYGHGDLFVQADNATYSGPFKQVLQKYGNDWLLIYEIFDLV